jgi:hypothetical protein
LVGPRQLAKPVKENAHQVANSSACGATVSVQLIDDQVGLEGTAATGRSG